MFISTMEILLGIRAAVVQILPSMLFFLFVGVAGHGIQRYDGWYNNLANPSWGSSGDEVIYKTTPAYSDLTYLPSGQRRPNPREISNTVFKGESGIPSYANRTVLFAYFGQFVFSEIVHSSGSNCPVELLKVPIPKDDPDFRTSSKNVEELPFLRSEYVRGSGQAPNNPRKPVNRATAWIDGSFLYGRGEVWANCLRAFKDGKLATLSNSSDYPALNRLGLPLDNYPNPTTHKMYDVNQMWMFGDPHSHQNAPLTSIALLWFRYHNYIATKTRDKHPGWHDEKIFQYTRRWTVSVMQNIIAYEWLPAFLNATLPTYTGYKSHVQPAITAVFEAAAFRVGHSHIPSGVYIRNRQCNYTQSIRLCNSYFGSQDIVREVGIEDVLLGVSSQICEREDHIIVEDLRGKSFGPLHFSRQDLCVLTLMRGRDHGLPNYNEARVAYGLPRVTEWKEINPALYEKEPEVFHKLRNLHKGKLSDLDIYPAGLLESTPQGPGPLFQAVILDQFERIRDGDRYWFENKKNQFFNNEELDRIRGIRFSDVIKMTLYLSDDEIQTDVFFWREGDPCPQPKQMVASDLEPCTPHKGFDYFVGSEISYITAFTCLGLVPFVCILVAVIIAKCKTFRLQKVKMANESVGKTCSCPVNSLHAYEWVTSHKSRHVDIQFDLEQCHLLVTANRKQIRVIDFSRQEGIAMWVANDNRKNTVLIHIPKEYDLVLVLSCEESKLELIQRIKDMLCRHDKPLHTHDCRTAYIFDKAVTKDKRQVLLTQFFRCVFAEAFDMNEMRPTDELQINQCKEIVTCELSRPWEVTVKLPKDLVVDTVITVANSLAEFAEGLALKPDSLFVSQMFSIIDRDHNGYVSFRELLYAVLLFTKGSCEDKMKLLFTMYDQDKSGSLSRSEVTQMIRSMMEIANRNLDAMEVEALVDKMFEKAGLMRHPSLMFEDFCAVLSDRLDMLWDVCLDWKGTKLCLPKKKPKPSTKSDTTSSSSSTTDLKDSSTNNKQKSSATSSYQDEAVEPRESSAPTPVSIFLKRARNYIENHRQHICYLLVFYSVVVILFFERFYYYTVEQEHRGFRSLTGSGVSVTRGAAACMSFTFSLLLLTMCRNTITKLRETFINLYVPFDSHVSFHKCVAYTALFFTVMHILGYCFNFYQMATQPVPFLCIFDELHFRSGYQPKIHFWLFGNLIGFTGILLTVVIAIIYVFATQMSRTHIFNAFWITHKFIYILYVLILLHGSIRLVQDPMFWYYFIGPAVLFAVDKMISLARQKQEISVVRAELLPSNVTLLEFKRPHSFEYRSGQWVRLAVQTLGREEYHSFTLTSAPHEDTLSVHVRSLGPWTWNIRRAFDPDNLREQPFPKAYIDGPYGAGQQDWYKYEVSVLVGGGIGVTPYASILKDFVFMSATKNTFKVKCQKLYFVWVTSSQKHFEWLVDILKTVEEHDKKGTVETHIFITQLFHQFDLRTTMLYICEEHFQKISGRSMFTDLAATTHFGRPKFDYILDAVRDRHPRVRKVGVFSCGPPGLTKGMEKACHQASTKGKARFEHHYENF